MEPFLKQVHRWKEPECELAAVVGGVAGGVCVCGGGGGGLSSSRDGVERGKMGGGVGFRNGTLLYFLHSQME